MRRQYEHELEQWGTVQTDHMKYAPLEEVRIRFTCRSRPDGDLFVRVYDGAGRQYARQTMTLRKGVGELTVIAGGVTEASACVAFPSSRTCLAYEFAQEGATTRLRFSGSGREVELRLPAAGAAVRATLNGEPVAAELRAIQGQAFWCLPADPAGVNELRLAAE